MARRIYRVLCEQEFFIAVDEECGSDPWQVARDSVRRFMQDAFDEPDISVSEAFNLRQVPREWQDGIFYGDCHGDETVAQIFAERAGSAP